MTCPAEAAERGFGTMGAVRGQNLGWLVNQEGSLTAFLIFGIGTEALAVIILFVLFRRRGWLGKGS